MVDAADFKLVLTDAKPAGCKEGDSLVLTCRLDAHSLGTA